MWTHITFLVGILARAVSDDTVQVTHIQGALSPEQEAGYAEMAQKLGTRLQDLYYQRGGKASKTWKKRFQCAVCQTAAGELGAVVGQLRGWTELKATEAHYSEYFDETCEAVSAYKLMAIEADSKQLITEGSPLRFLQPGVETSINAPFMTTALLDICTDLASNHYQQLVHLELPTGRFAIQQLCIDGPLQCDNVETLYQAIYNMDQEELSRATQVAVKSLDALLVQVVPPEAEEPIERERDRVLQDFRCMACDKAVYRLLDVIDYKGYEKIHKRRPMPTPSELVGACGDPESWSNWGVAFDFWNETVRPDFLQEDDYASSTMKLPAAEGLIPEMLWKLCKELATSNFIYFDGGEPPPTNCHYAGWCDNTRWAGDSTNNIFMSYEQGVAAGFLKKGQGVPSHPDL